jgi:hypothetical protein
MIAVLPTPPTCVSSWSLITLAAHLCTPPADVYLALCPFIKAHGVGPTFGARRAGHQFWLPDETGTSGVTVTDSYLSDAAVAHLLERLPVGPLAREIVALGEAYPGDPMWAMARHLVTYLGGA